MSPHEVCLGLLAVDLGIGDTLISILLEGAAEMPGCLSYVVARDPADPTGLWVTEVCDSQASHEASLSLPAVQQAIARGKPLIARFAERFVTEPIGGRGLVATGSGR